MSERKFVIVDGSSLLSTCYYAVLPREIMFAKTDEEKEKHYGKILHASDGTYTNGIMGGTEGRCFPAEKAAAGLRGICV